LAFIGRSKGTYLQFYGNKAIQAAVVEEQIQKVIVVVNPHGILSPNKTEIGPQFGKKLFQVPNDGGLKILFGVRTLQSQEVENIGILEGS